MEKKVCIAMVPCPGHGHLIPFVEFAKRFLLHNNNNGVFFHVTILVPTQGSPSSSTIAILNALPSNMDFTFLPSITMDQLHNPPTHPIPRMKLIVQLSLPSLRKALTSLTSRTTLVALVSHFFSIDSLLLAQEFNIFSCVLYSAGATSLCFSLSFPMLDKESDNNSNDEFLDLTKPVKVSGCSVSFQVKDLPDLIHFPRSSEVYKSYLDVCKALSLVDVVILNSFNSLEGDTIGSIQKEKTAPFVCPIGPIIQTESGNEANKLECVRWLENQPPKSVLYICFGSGGTISHEQLNEIAHGLELSGHRFLWVLRPPSKISESGYLIVTKNDDPLEYLPSGFLNRTKGQGLVVPSWAPQIEILAHGSTGAFLSHCGWSSAMESIIHGVPIIALPLFAEQRMNATLFTDLLKVALRPEQGDADENGIVTRDQVVKVIKRIMESDEGLEVRKRTRELSDAAFLAIKHNGSSYMALSSLAQKWRLKSIA
ncbi:hypothetical protein HN51_021295 [Arachis hypogaea]|uniref:hydroquinone glucosyltransferase-like n=1 Tax=Arachis hypogaea TaxID=3818 RepID=UPI000DED2168|nr:hydroquinone glucosyltransferase-like [Arachis hypogaea]QHO52358.1 Hydroquinone glucosyltransferase [Arachis hypogaea]